MYPLTISSLTRCSRMRGNVAQRAATGARCCFVDVMPSDSGPALLRDVVAYPIYALLEWHSRLWTWACRLPWENLLPFNVTNHMIAKPLVDNGSYSVRATHKRSRMILVDKITTNIAKLTNIVSLAKRKKDVERGKLIAIEIALWYRAVSAPRVNWCLCRNFSVTLVFVETLFWQTPVRRHLVAVDTLECAGTRFLRRRSWPGNA